MFIDTIMGSNGAWTVNETELSIFSKVKTLKIHKADPTNMGIFVCRASNSIGNAEREVQLYRKYFNQFNKSLNQNKHTQRIF